jgi:hypothetical protein
VVRAAATTANAVTAAGLVQVMVVAGPATSALVWCAYRLLRRRQTIKFLERVYRASDCKKDHLLAAAEAVRFAEESPFSCRSGKIRSFDAVGGRHAQRWEMGAQRLNPAGVAGDGEPR